MPSQLFCGRIVSLLLLINLSVAACIKPITAPPSASTPANDPVAVFDAFNAAVNAHDVDAALSFFAEDAIAQFPNQPPPNLHKGSAEIRTWLESDIKDDIHVEIENTKTASDTVSATAKVAVDSLPPDLMLVGTVEVTVKNGKITAFSYLLSDETLAKLQALQPPSPVEFMRKIDTSVQQIKNPVGLAVDGEGNVYVTDGSDMPRVLKYDSQGNFVLAWGSRGSGEGQFEFIPPSPDAGPTAGFVAVDEQDNVYVSDAYNFRVQKFDADGHFLMQFGSKGSGEGQFDEPGAGPLYVGGQGNIYVSTFPRVQKFDANGTFLAAYGKVGAGEGEFNGAALSTIDDQGNLYMADALNHRMQKLDPTGKFLLQWGGEGTDAGQFLWAVTAVLDSEDNLYVADNTGRIQIFDTEGNFLAQWSETGAGNPPLGGDISGLTIDGQDNIYVADGTSPSIYIFRPRKLAAAPAEEPATTAVPIPDLGESPLRISSATPYGQFNGIDYVKYTGHLVNTTGGEPFDAPFEIVVPADPSQGNGRLLVEPFHLIEGAGAREKFLTPEFLFGRGFSHAAICWQAPMADVEAHPCTAFAGQPVDELRIIADFARLLKTNEAAKLAGKVDKLYSIGFSNSADPLLLLLRDPLGQHLFDLSFVLNSGWPLPRPDDFAPPLEEVPASLLPAESAGRVIVLLTEADVVLWHAALLRDDGAHPNYRSYEVAGASHIPAPLYDVNQLDWLPIMRALFVAGDRWISQGVEPPSSRFLATANTDTLDPVYQRPTGVARDENLNAKGGIRLPDLTLGRSQFIAVDAANFVLVGKFIDLKCTSLADGSARFPDHATYIRRFTQETQRLVEEGFLLPGEAKLLIEAAQASDVGTPVACA